MPLVRYETGDYGYLFSHAHVSHILRDFGYDSYIPHVASPLMAVAGRLGQSLRVADRLVSVEFLRSLLYSDYGVASGTTGQFRVAKVRDRLSICVQMRSQSPGRGAIVQRRLSKLINGQFPADVRMVPYFDFRHGMGVDYERKFRHLAG
jgi:hypothetical protein